MRGEAITKNLIGQRFGRLIVTEKTEQRQYRHVVWKCICDCGNATLVSGGSLLSGRTQSCGCLLNEKRGTGRRKHGQSTTKLYGVWSAMKKRCTNEKQKCFASYGGRGITVCKEWESDFQAFHDWAMANGYAEGLTIDRIDVNGNYEPANCRWISIQAQQRNRRTNHMVTFNGETHSITEWSEITGLSRNLISNRLITLGWDVERALMTQPSASNNHA